MRSQFRSGGEQIVWANDRCRHYRVDGAIWRGGRMVCYEFLECGGSHGVCPTCSKNKKPTDDQQEQIKTNHHSSWRVTRGKS